MFKCFFLDFWESLVLRLLFVVLVLLLIEIYLYYTHAGTQMRLPSSFYLHQSPLIHQALFHFIPLSFSKPSVRRASIS